MGQSKMDNPDKLETQGTQDTGTNKRQRIPEGAIKNEQSRETKQTLEDTEEPIKNGQSRETGNIGYTKRQSTQKHTTQYALDTTTRKQTQLT